MNILVIDDEDAIRQITVMNMENIFPGAHIIEANSALKSIDIILENKLDLIICDYNMPENNGNFVYEHLLSTQNLQVPFILYSAASPLDIKNFKLLEELDFHSYLQKPLTYEQFSQKILKLISQTNLMPKPPFNQEYIKIRTSYFWRFNQTSCDIFISLAPNKFVKIINKHDSYDKTLIDKYINKNQQYLYIQTSQIENFTQDMATLPFLSFTEDSGPFDADKVSERIKITTAILRDLVHTIGVSQNSYKSAESFTRDIEQIIENSSLSSLFSKIKTKNNYLFDHSFLLACICVDAIKEFDWHNHKSIEKLCFSALFHDISQVDPDLAMVNSIEEAQIKGFTPDEVKRFARHPIMSANYVLECPDIDPQVAQIIQQHHENPDGTGFPDGLNSEQVSQLTAIFVIAHQLVKELYDHQFDPDFLKSLIPQIKQTFNTGIYKIVFPAFESIFAKSSEERCPK